jgi:hypothetical protein
MKTILALTALTLAGSVMAGYATNPSAEMASETASVSADRGPDACFRSGDIINVNIVDDRTLYIATRRGYVYRLDAPGGCYVQGARVSIGAFRGGSDSGACAGNQARIAAGSSPCIAQVTGPYTDSRETGLWARSVAP